MLIKFFRNGQGGGAGPVDCLIDREVVAYDQNRNPLLDEHGNAVMAERLPRPDVIEGNPDRMRALIDSTPYQWTYRAGVIAFTHEDAPTADQQRDVITSFEDLAFAGLEADQRDVLWVRHTHEDRVELHFVTPRMELESGRSFNIAPPGYQKHYDALRDVLNKQHNWNDPQAPERARDVVSLIESARRGEAREQIHEWISDRIVGGEIADRSDMISALSDAGFDIPRAGKNYITVRDPETNERWRLKGDIFHEEWTREQSLDKSIERETEHQAERASRSGSRLDALDLGELHDRLRGFIEKREAYNRKRYRVSRSIDRTRDERDTDHHERSGGADPERVATDLTHQPLDHVDHHRDELRRQLVLGEPYDRQGSERQPLADGAHSPPNRKRGNDRLEPRESATLTMPDQSKDRSLSSPEQQSLEGNFYGRHTTTDTVGTRINRLRGAVSRSLGAIERNLQRSGRTLDVAQRFTSLINPIRHHLEQWRDIGRRLTENLTRHRTSLEQSAERELPIKPQDRTR